MASLRDIRSRISSVKSTRQITSAMKMVSAAKLKKAQDRIQTIRPFVIEMNGIIYDLSEHLTDNISSVYTQERTIEKLLVVLITSNRGLCGGFNTNICKKSIKFIEEKYSQLADDNKIDFFCFGKKAADFIKKTKYPIIGNDNHIFDNVTYENISLKATDFMQMFSEFKYDRIEIVYNSFKVASQSNLIEETYLPYQLHIPDTEFPTEYIFEPNIEHILNIIIPDYLKTKLFSIFLDSIAAEHGARMTAMHQATDNASELIKELTLAYNKARQATITKEILEITSGAEALRSS